MRSRRQRYCGVHLRWLHPLAWPVRHRIPVFVRRRRERLSFRDAHMFEWYAFRFPYQCHVRCAGIHILLLQRPHAHQRPVGNRLPSGNCRVRTIVRIADAYLLEWKPRRIICVHRMHGGSGSRSCKLHARWRDAARRPVRNLLHGIFRCFWRKLLEYRRHAHVLEWHLERQLGKQ